MRFPLLTFLLLAALSAVSADKITTTGWIADQGCARARATSGVYTPTNPDCAMKCVEKGDKLVLIAEKEKAIYVVDSPDTAKDHWAEHLEVSGTLDRATNRLHVETVKDLGDYVGPACARPRKRGSGTPHAH